MNKETTKAKLSWVWLVLMLIVNVGVGAAGLAGVGLYAMGQYYSGGNSDLWFITALGVIGVAVVGAVVGIMAFIFGRKSLLTTAAVAPAICALLYFAALSFASGS